MISPWQCHALEAPDGEEDFGGSLTDKSLLSHRQTQIPSQCPHVHTRDRTGGKVDLMIQIKLKFELSFFFHLQIHIMVAAEKRWPLDWKSCGSPVLVCQLLANEVQYSGCCMCMPPKQLANRLSLKTAHWKLQRLDKKAWTRGNLSERSVLTKNLQLNGGLILCLF